MTGLLVPLGEVAAVLGVAAALGWGAAALVIPRGSRVERLAWGFAAGLTMIGLSVALAFALRIHAGWLPFLIVSVLVVLPTPLLRLRDRGREPERTAVDPTTVLLFLVLLAGIALYALRCLTEPMWANDFLAIWGLKGKTFFAEGRVPQRFFHWTSLAFSHPEYPLGLPFLYAGIASLAGKWDDHAMALLFPLLQVATLAALFGWLRRRGAAAPLALGVVAVLSNFEPLYRAFATGMAEVPLSFGVLLLGTSLCDRLERTDAGASRRLALASFVCAATKNEGLFFVTAGVVVAALSAFSRRGAAARAVAVLALPAALVVAAHHLIRGSLPLTDFDFSLLGRPGELLPRVREALEAVVLSTPRSAFIGLVALVVLIGAGRTSPAGGRLLLLAACGLAAYLFLPALAVAGPAWLVETAFFRTTAALAPLVAAGVAVRLIALWPASGESTGSSAGPEAFAGSP